MNEKERLQELKDFKILDTLPEKELDELAEIASAICDTPISLLSLVDDKRQWFKSIKGLDVSQTPREVAFCQHALHNPNEVLVIDDPLNDERFRNNPLVLGNPHIRFYAGAPLETSNGNVLGTLCVIDNKPRNITDSQKKALMLLAKKAMDYLETRKLLLEKNEQLEYNAENFRKLTDQAPGVIFQLEMNPAGKLSFPYISNGLSVIHPTINAKELKDKPELAFDVVHPDDLPAVQESLYKSFAEVITWDVEYRVITHNGSVCWHWAYASPEKLPDGTVALYGTFQNITVRKEYIETLEQIVFDISHVMRRPIATMLGLTAAIEDHNLDKKTLMQYIAHIKTVSAEMDNYMKKLNKVYEKKFKAFRDE